MKIYAINSVTPRNQQIRRAKATPTNQPDNSQPAFKSAKGKLIGGVLGASVTGLLTIAALATTGPLAAAVLLAAETGGAVGGGALGNALSGKDDD